MKKRVSLKDIASKVGVSTTLVSYVLNNQLENRISQKTAEKIRKVAAELNYHPNQIAKSLKNNRTQTLGLIVADISNPFSSSVARKIEDEAKKNHYTVIFGSADENCQKAQNLIDVLLSRQVDGFIIAPPEGFEKHLKKLRQEGVPFVLIDRYFEDLNVSYIAVDNYAITYKAVRYLIDHGFTNIGFVNYQTKLIHLQERNRGYREALAKANIPFAQQNLKEIKENNLKTEIRIAIDSLLRKKKPVDALFFSSSKVAIEGLAYLRQLDVVVPDEVGVVCFDETEAYQLFQYPVTYIRQPLEKIGQMAVQLLLKNVEGRSEPQEMMLKTEMVIQASSRKTKKRIV